MVAPPNPVVSFLGWLSSVFFRASNLVTGGALALGVELYDKANSQAPSTVTFILWIAAGCFVWGSYRTWQEQNNTLKATRADLVRETERNTPNLDAEIDVPVYFQAGTANVIGVSLPITVHNPAPCAPSAAEVWRVSIIASDGVKRTFIPERMWDGFSMTQHNGTFSYPAQDDIPGKTKEPAIGIGDSRSGYLTTMLPGFTRESLNGTRLVVEFKDVNKKMYSAEIVVDTANINPDIQVLGGTQARFIMTPQAIAQLYSENPLHVLGTQSESSRAQEDG